MRRILRNGAVAAATLMVFLLSLIAPPGLALGAAEREKAAYTILVYMNGSDLESKGYAATRDLLEMVQVGSTEQVHVLVETLGTSRWTPDFIDPKRNQRWRVEKGRVVLVDDSLGRRDVADPATLTDFIQWGMKNYPAERYAIIFWNHGGGAVAGYGLDETNPDNPSLGLQGIQKGIGDAVAATGEHFELIGFDTCLLATIEMAALLSPYARYLVASEELEPGHGWHYTPVLQAVTAEPAITGDRLGQVIADGFRAQAVQQRTDKMITLSVIDLVKIQGVVDALQAFLSAAAPGLAGEEGLLTFQRARFQAESYGSTADMVDLADLVTKAAPIAPAEAAQLLAAIGEAVVYNINSPGTPRAAGLSIYFPHKGKHQIEARLDRYGRIGFSPAYRELITDYAAATFAATEPVALASAVPVAESTGERSTHLSIRVEPEQAHRVATVRSFLAQYSTEQEDELIILSIDNLVDFNEETGEIGDTFTGYVVALNGRYAAMYLEQEGEDFDRYAIPIRLNGEEMDLIVLYSLITDEHVIIGAWPGIDEETGIAPREIIKIKPGDRIVPIFASLNETTDEEGVYEGEEFTVKGKLYMEYYELPAGRYLYGFEVVDWAGNTEMSDLYEVTVEYEEGYVPLGELEDWQKEWVEEWEKDEGEDEGDLVLVGDLALKREAAQNGGGGAPQPEPQPEPAPDEIRVSLNGQTLRFDVPPEIRNGRTLVPLRAIFEAIGASITWDGATQRITAIRSSTSVQLQVGNPVAVVDDAPVTLDQAPVISDGRTLVPLRFVSEALGAEVQWNGATRIITITTDN